MKAPVNISRYIKQISYVCLLCGFLAGNARAAPTINRGTKLHRISKRLLKPQPANDKRERARKKAIAEMKRRTGCVKPDEKKIAAEKAAQLKYKENH